MKGELGESEDVRTKGGKKLRNIRIAVRRCGMHSSHQLSIKWASCVAFFQLWCWRVEKRGLEEGGMELCVK